MIYLFTADLWSYERLLCDQTVNEVKWYASLCLILEFRCELNVIYWFHFLFCFFIFFFFDLFHLYFQEQLLWFTLLNSLAITFDECLLTIFFLLSFFLFFVFNWMRKLSNTSIWMLSSIRIFIFFPFFFFNFILSRQQLFIVVIRIAWNRHNVTGLIRIDQEFIGNFILLLFHTLVFQLVPIYHWRNIEKKKWNNLDDLLCAFFLLSLNFNSDSVFIHSLSYFTVLNVFMRKRGCHKSQFHRLAKQKKEKEIFREFFLFLFFVEV